VDWRHLTTGSSGLAGQVRSQIKRMFYGRLALKEKCNRASGRRAPWGVLN